MNGKRGAAPNRRPAIIYVTSSYPFGPGEPFIRPELEWIQGHHADVVLVPMRPRGNRRGEEDIPDGVRVVDSGLLSPRIVLGAVRVIADAPIATLRLLARTLGQDTWRVRARNLAVLAKALWLGGEARRINAQHIHAYWASAPATIAMVAGLTAHLPWSFTGHRWDLLHPNLIQMKAQTCAFGRATSAEGLRRALEGVDAAGSGKLTLEYTGIEVPPARAIDDAPDEGQLTILCPALLIERKDHRSLLRGMAAAVQAGADARLLIAGSGPLRRTLEDLVVELGCVGRVDFLGHLGHAELLALYDAGGIDAVALTSRDEGLPFGLLEPMARSIPVVATAVGGVPELLADGGGILVPAGDHEAVAHAIMTLASDPSVRRQMARQARSVIERSFDARRQAQQMGDRFLRA